MAFESVTKPAAETRPVSHANSSDDPRAPWLPLLNAVGQDIGSVAVADGADAVDRSSIRRFLEPLEFACGLHDDEHFARSCGFQDIVAPASSLLTFTIPPIWSGEDSAYTKADTDALPLGAAIGPGIRLVPPDARFFASDLEIDYLEPILLGDRLRRSGRRLTECSFKSTRVGDGVFAQLTSDVLRADGAVVGVVRLTLYLFLTRLAEINHAG